MPMTRLSRGEASLLIIQVKSSWSLIAVWTVTDLFSMVLATGILPSICLTCLLFRSVILMCSFLTDALTRFLCQRSLIQFLKFASWQNCGMPWVCFISILMTSALCVPMSMSKSSIVGRAPKLIDRLATVGAAMQWRQNWRDLRAICLQVLTCLTFRYPCLTREHFRDR